MDALSTKPYSIDGEKLANLQIKVVEMASSGVIISDAQAEGNPIIYVNDRFTEITGYESHEVIGKNCNFLQGEGTHSGTIDEIRNALKLFIKYEGEILNYKKSGCPFWNHLIIIPIFEEGIITNHLAIIKDNTQLRHKNLQIRKVQDNLEYLISKSNIIIYTCDFPSLRIQHVSENIFKELGYEQQELLDQSITDLVKTDYRENLMLSYKLLEHEKEFVCEHQIQLKTQEYIWVEHRVKLITNDLNEPLEIIGYLENINSRRREQALNKANKSLESLVNSRTVELLIRSQELADYGRNLKKLHKISTRSFDSNTELIETFLKVGCEIFNLETGVVTKKGEEYFLIEAHHSKLYELEDRSKFPARGSRCNQSIKREKTIMSHNAHIDLKIIASEEINLKIQTHLTTPIKVNDISYGTLSFFCQKAKKHSFNHYQVEMIEMMAQSIGTALAKEQAVKKRRHIEGLYMALAQNIPHSAVFIFDENLKYLVAEGQILKENKITDICEKTLWQILPPEECKKYEAYHRSALLGMESTFESNYGGKAYLSHSIPIRDEEGKIYAGMILTVDITERKQRALKIENLNKDLNQQVTLLEFANKELESFNYSVSHDLRAPLRSISGFSKILTEEHATTLDSETKRLINIINSESKRMSLLIDDLLSFSKLRRTEQVYSLFSLNVLVDEVYNQFSFATSSKNLEFVKRDLPDMYADRNMIKQLISNLISNAVKFSAKEAYPRVEVDCISDDKTHIIKIEDNGVGFNDKYKQKLFGVFQRLHSFEEFEGTGVGLALVQRIAQRHNGKVWAEGQVGKGAKFYFSIPKILYQNKA